MWALAALYLRAGLAKKPGFARGYARLAHAYVRLGRRDLAVAALEEARRIDPHDPATAELVALIEGAQDHSDRGTPLA
jgi:cytochrome c-type biogenesis protein CcmH/NrfG